MAPALSLIVPVLPAGRAAKSFLAPLAALLPRAAELPAEILVVDCGSADRSYASLLALRDRFPQLTLLRQDGGTPAEACGLGLALAKGNFIAFAEPQRLAEAWDPALCAVAVRENADLAVRLPGGGAPLCFPSAASLHRAMGLRFLCAPSRVVPSAALIRRAFLLEGSPLPPEGGNAFRARCFALCGRFASLPADRPPPGDGSPEPLDLPDLELLLDLKRQWALGSASDGPLAAAWLPHLYRICAAQLRVLRRQKAPEDVRQQAVFRWLIDWADHPAARFAFSAELPAPLPPRLERFRALCAQRDWISLEKMLKKDSRPRKKYTAPRPGPIVRKNMCGRTYF
jgi:hypothetical protein